MCWKKRLNKIVYSSFHDFPNYKSVPLLVSLGTEFLTGEFNLLECAYGKYYQFGFGKSIHSMEDIEQFIDRMDQLARQGEQIRFRKVKIY
jgi:hypothetical protein